MDASQPTTSKGKGTIPAQSLAGFDKVVESHNRPFRNAIDETFEEVWVIPPPCERVNNSSREKKGEMEVSLDSP